MVDVAPVPKDPTPRPSSARTARAQPYQAEGPAWYLHEAGDLGAKTLNSNLRRHSDLLYWQGLPRLSLGESYVRPYKTGMSTRNLSDKGVPAVAIWLWDTFR